MNRCLTLSLERCRFEYQVLQKLLVYFGSRTVKVTDVLGESCTGCVGRLARQDVTSGPAPSKINFSAAPWFLN